MAGRNNKNSKRGYRSPNIVNGNLARKLDNHELDRRGQTDSDQHRQQMAEAQRRFKHRAKVRASIRPAQPVSLAAIGGALCVAGLMVALLLCYVKMNTISRSIVSMKTQIAELEVEQVSLLTRHAQVFDLSTVKEAAEAAGMKQPNDSQVFYIRLPGENRATAHKRGGALGNFFAAFHFVPDTAAEYFG